MAEALSTVWKAVGEADFSKPIEGLTDNWDGDLIQRYHQFCNRISLIEYTSATAKPDVRDLLWVMGDLDYLFKRQYR